jgi:hypothetical protein
LSSYNEPLTPSLQSVPKDTATNTDNITSKIQIPKSCHWAFMTCRPPVHSPLLSQSGTIIAHHDDVLSLVFEYIYRETPYYVSCGAKFGCDFLLYDGPREERHAFAGLRVLSPSPLPPQHQGCSTIVETTKTKAYSILPIPTAYSLTSFVRCLNTAGKLSLLATVTLEKENDDDPKAVKIFGDSDAGSCSQRSGKNKYRVLFVDVALEKVLDAPTHQRRRGGKAKIQERRKDITKNLAKK